MPEIDVTEFSSAEKENRKDAWTASHAHMYLQLPPTVTCEYRQKRKFGNSSTDIQICSMKNSNFWDSSVKENRWESCKNNEQLLFPYNTKK